MANTATSEQPTRRLLGLLNQLDELGTLSQFYQTSVVGLAVYSQREIYNYYHALLGSPSYADRPHKAALATAQGCQVGRSTVYRALHVMEQQVG